VAYEAVEGEAAFYGPKADLMAMDALGREWQLSTIQIDFIQPARLGVEYIGEDGQPHTPVLIHRAVTGSTERFLGVLIGISARSRHNAVQAQIIVDPRRRIRAICWERSC
jgi:threonyl-tRNA synthetase